MVDSLLLRFWFGFGFHLIEFTNSILPEAYLLPIIMPDRTKSSKTVADGDRISGLPEPIVHHIMSFLPSEDVARAGSLSKTWQSLGSTNPNLYFDQTAFQRALPETLSAVEKLDLFLTSLNRSLQGLEERSMNVHKLKLHAIVQDPRLFELAVKRALKSNAQEIELDYYDLDNRYYKIPQCLYSAKPVKRMKLTGFEAGIVDLLSGCPSIEELDLVWCNSSEGVKFSSDKLLKFHVELQVCGGLKSIELDACNLQSFSYYGYAIDYNAVRAASSVTRRTCTINLSTCTFLRKLSLKNAKVSDQWLERHISALAHLEDLSLVRCGGLAIVRIFHEKLKRLHLISCIKVEEAEIDCPKLRRFVFEGGLPRFGFLNSSGSLVATLTVQKGTTIWWFHQFRRLLGLFDHCKTLEIVCDSYEELVFPEEARESFLPPLHDLKHLKINCRSSTVDYTELVDNLLWLSPHLEIMFLNSEVEKHCLKFQYKKISEEKGEEDILCCCRAYPKECWRHCLERVIIDNLDGSANGNDNRKNLLNFFCENAKGLESIQD
ncbi:putative F-box/LRR-repeat protein At4g00320 [Rhododendron vialii]|uniref:putative F-box/LRR-repeat protein At4g00320 n=1 Tax=Rhododendron vialii TaxID=182163 RepID=UPI00265FEB45|nr:putative F-box/LRR-repeat protein At4g00320 [Rhododendron vialii]